MSDDGQNFTNPGVGAPVAVPQNQYNNPNAFSMADAWQDKTAYGGQARTYNRDGSMNPGGADIATERYQGMGSAAAGRGAYKQDFGNYQSGMSAANRARGTQSDALGLMNEAAYGRQPSQAQLLGRNMQDQSLAAQMAASASARGGPLATASAQNAASNAAAAQRQQGSNSIAAMRADEMARAREAYMGGATAQRQGDFTGSALGLQKTGLQTQNEQFQRGLNQNAQMGYEQMGQQAQEDQMRASMGEHQIAEQGWEHQGNIGQHSQDRETGVIGGLVGGAGHLLGGLFAHGGRMPREGAYLVGEEGPELIVPKHDGFVFTAPQTEFIRETMTPEQHRALGGGIAARFAGGPVGGFGAPPGGDPFGSMSVNGGGLDVMGSIQKTSDQEIGSQMRQTGGLAGALADGGPVNGSGGEHAAQQKLPSAASKAFNGFSEGFTKGFAIPYGVPVGVPRYAHGGSIAAHVHVPSVPMRRAPTLANALAGVEALKTRVGNG